MNIEIKTLWSRARSLWQRPAVKRDIDEELLFHLEQCTADNIAAGMSPEDAARQARKRFGNLLRIREDCRDVRGVSFGETTVQDIRFGLRILRKSPGFSCAAILILALGIGGVTAMFSTLYSVMIQPLPYFAPDRLVLGRATFSGNINPWVAGPDYMDYRETSRSFSALEAFFPTAMDVTITTGRTAERARSQMASVGLFGALGVKISSGRPFKAEEGQDGAPPVAIVSHAYWQKNFPGESELAGRSLMIDGVSFELVGVTPPGFQFIHDVDVWMPLRPQNLGPRRFNNFLILGRLKDGVTLAEAQSEVDVISAQLEKAYPDTNTDKALLLTPLQGAFAEQYRSSFGLLCGGAAAILLIAWANAAGLLLARGAGRQGELAVRAAMGGSRWRLMRLLMTEALILAGAAGVLGMILAIGIQNGLLRMMPIETLLLRKVGLSLPVLLFVLTTTVLTGFGFGVLPAWRARQVNLAQDLRSSGRGTVRQSVRLRRGLVAGQVTVSFVLLVVAGLLTRSFTSLHEADPGFNYRNLLTAEVPLPPGDYPAAKRSAFFAGLLDEVKALPGVSSAAAISQLPVRNPYNNVGIYAADAPPANLMEGGDGFQRVVLPGYFKAMGIPLLAGRDIQPEDSASSHRVVVISKQMARTLFPNRDPLGRHVVIDRQTDATWEVIGVVGDVKQDDLRQDYSTRGSFYRAHTQQPWSTMRLAVRTAGDPLAVVSPLRSLLRKMDRNVPLAGPRTMEAVMANSTVSEKAQAACLATFSVLAVALAAVGIYGLLAYVVTQRYRETGIRMALGATRRDIAWPIVREAFSLALAGLFVGGLCALPATQSVRATLYGVGPGDPVSFAGAALLLLLVATLAAWLPARCAARVEPTTALRFE